MAGPRIGYVVMSFPLLSETFVINEAAAVRGQGLDVRIFSLRRPREPFRHPEAEALLPYTRQLPFLCSWSLWAAAGRWMVCRPRTLGRLVGQVVAGTWRRPGILVRTLAVLPMSLLLAREAQRLGIRHLHAHFANYPATAAWVASELVGGSFSFTAHAHDLFRDQCLLAQKLRRAKAAFAISEYNRAYLAGLGGRDCCPLHVVRMGANLERFTPQPREAEPEAALHLLAVARLDPMKGLAYLVQACYLLERQGIAFECVIAGEGEQRRELEGLIARWGLEGRVRLAGWVDGAGVVELMRWADVVVLPCVPTREGKQDGIPVVLMEAMACGLPVVSTAISGIPELVRAGCGLLVPPGETAALALALEELTNPARRERLGRAARAAVEKEYDAAANARVMADHLRRLAGEPAPGPAPRQVPVLLYHRITPAGGAPASWPAADPMYALSEQAFCAHLDTLQQAGYETLGPEDLWNWSLGLARLPARPVLIAFDDGDPSHCQVAAPALAKRGMRGTFFITTGVVGTRSGLSWAELAELVRAGHSVGSHGVTHRSLCTLGARELEYELAQSRHALEQGLGAPVHFAAVPNGAYSRRVARACRRVGYLGTFTSDCGTNRLSTSPFAWRRIPVRSGVAAPRLLALCGGTFPGWHLAAARAWGLALLRRGLGEAAYRWARCRLLYTLGRWP